jgi:hypothetical protein
MKVGRDLPLSTSSIVRTATKANPASEIIASPANAEPKFDQGFLFVVMKISC